MYFNVSFQLFAESDYACCMLEKTPKQSLALGRHLYVLQQNEKLYWLKSQNSNGHPEWVVGFQREIEIYHKFSSACFLLPSQILYSCQNLDSPDMLRTPHSEVALSNIQQLSLLEIKQKIHAVLSCVAQVHQAKIIHGDLKPSHLRLYKQKVKLIDFEHAQFLSETLEQAQMNATPRYMAPELFSHAQKTIQSDLYALGIIFYEWLMQNRIAIQDYHDWAMYHCQQSNFELPTHLKRLQSLLNGLLARNVSQRFTSAEQAIQRLVELKH